MNRQYAMAVARRTVGAVLTFVPMGFVAVEVLLQFINAMTPRLLGALRGGPVVITPPCATPDCDFSVFWPAGVVARTDNFQGVYNPDQFLILRHEILMAGIQRLDWFYPPPSLLPVAVISLLPFNIAYFVWIAIFLLGAVVILRGADVGWGVIAAGLLSPAALWSMEMGQFEMLSNAVLVAGLLRATQAPRRAGVLFGLLVLKPQTGLLAPIGLLVTCNWQALVAGAATVAGLLVVTTASFGWDVWPAYIENGLAASRLTLTVHTVGFERGVSVFWMVRSLGGSLSTCYVAQGLASVTAVALAALAWRHTGFSVLERMALTVFLTLLASPFGYVDDMVAYSIALAALAQARGWRLDLLDGFFYFWPALCPSITLSTGILFTPIVVALALTRTYWRASA